MRLGRSYVQQRYFGRVPARPDKTVTLRVVDEALVPMASLSGLRWAWSDPPYPHLLATPTDKGSNGATNAQGILVLHIPNSTLASGAAGYLVFSNSDGTVDPSPSYRSFAAPARVD